MSILCFLKNCVNDLKARVGILEDAQPVAGSFCAFGNVEGDGSITLQGGDWTVVRNGVGDYCVTYDDPLDTAICPIVSVYEELATRDSISIRYYNVTVNGFCVHITEGDNGTAANVLRDRKWSFAIPCGDPVGTTIAGPAGAQGIQGVQGVPGVAGANGTNGTNGTNGVDGQDGQDGADGLDAPLSSAIPIPDNELETAIRTGSAGTSGDVSRADHNHPIRRQIAPPRPAPTFSGPAGSTMTSVINLDTWTEEETVTFSWRIQVDASAATGWNIITIPGIGGFQVPQITIEGTYRNTGNPSLTQPRAPYMGNEANHWSSTQRIYIAQFNQKVGTGRYYVSVTARYVRA